MALGAIRWTPSIHYTTADGYTRTCGPAGLLTKQVVAISNGSVTPASTISSLAVPAGGGYPAIRIGGTVSGADASRLSSGKYVSHAGEV